MNVMAKKGVIRPVCVLMKVCACCGCRDNSSYRNTDVFLRWSWYWWLCCGWWCLLADLVKKTGVHSCR